MKKRATRSVVFVIMAGGKGERLWPLVRTHAPKVCLRLDGEQSLLQATVDRLTAAVPTAEWLVATTQQQADAVRASLPPRMRRAVLAEPEGRNTAACITLAAATLACRDPNGVMAVVPADHWIDDPAAYARAIQTAIRAADQQDTIVTIGVRPTQAHLGLGYVCTSDAIPGFHAPAVYRVRQFIEKPTLGVARRLLRQRRTLWNSGIFVGRSQRFLEVIAHWLPEHARAIVPLVRQSARWTPTARRAYASVPAISFDHGVMDHLTDGLVVEGKFRWADVGSLDSWARLRRSSTPAVTVDGQRVCVISADSHLIATIGVSDVLVVHTPSATLVCRSDQAQAVRDVVRRLESDHRLAAFR